MQDLTPNLFKKAVKKNTVAGYRDRILNFLLTERQGEETLETSSSHTLAPFSWTMNSIFWFESYFSPITQSDFHGGHEFAFYLLSPEESQGPEGWVTNNCGW